MSIHVKLSNFSITQEAIELPPRFVTCDENSPRACSYLVWNIKVKSLIMIWIQGPYFVLSWVAVLRTVSWDLLSRLLSWDLRHFELCMNYISSPFPLLPSVLSWESQDSVLKSVLTSPCSLHMAKITVLRSIKSCPEFAVLTQDTHFIACCPESGHCPESGQHKIGPLHYKLLKLTEQQNQFLLLLGV